MTKDFKGPNGLKTAMIGILLISILVIGLSGCTSQSGSSTGAASSSQNNATGNTADTDGDGIPDSAEKTLGTNPYSADTDGDGIPDNVDKDPAFTENLIKETSTTPLAVTMKDVKVEDNATTDHLEMTIVNNGQTVLNNFDIYYSITDKVDKKQEAYYQVLTGLSLNLGETKTIHFDNSTSEAGHYFGNMNGLYGTSQNGLTFDIQLHSSGFKPLQFNVDKAKGTAEVAD